MVGLAVFLHNCNSVFPFLLQLSLAWMKMLFSRGRFYVNVNYRVLWTKSNLRRSVQVDL